MSIFVKDPQGLLETCSRLKGWPRKGQQLWLADPKRCACDPGNLSKALRGNGLQPLAPSAVYWLTAAFRGLGVSLSVFTETRRVRKSMRYGPTAIALPDGQRAFEVLRDRALYARAREARVLVWSCETSKIMIKCLLESGCSVELLISQPLSYRGTNELGHKVRTSASFLARDVWREAIGRSSVAARISVSGYERYKAPFRGFHVPGIGVAVGAYQSPDGVTSKNSAMCGDSLPAILVSSDDPGYKPWAQYFDDQFERLRANAAPLMEINAKRARILDELTRRWIDTLQQSED